MCDYCHRAGKLKLEKKNENKARLYMLISPMAKKFNLKAKKNNPAEQTSI